MIQTTRPLTYVTPARATRVVLCLAALAAAVVALFAATPAAAAKPCYLQLIDDWQADGRIDKVYPKACYKDALDNLPVDLRDYSSLPDDIRRALALAVHNTSKPGGPTSGPSSTNPGSRSASPNSTPPASEPAGPSGHPGKSNGVFGRVIDWLGPDNADSVPIPLLILAGLGMLLLAAGGASYAARRIHARRVGLPASAPPRPPDR